MSQQGGLQAVLRRAISVGTGRALGQLVNLVSFPIILRFVSPAEFGAFTLLQTVALVWGVVMSCGLSTAFFSRAARSASEGTESFPLLGIHLTQQFVLGGGLLILGLALGPQVSRLLAPEVPVLPLLILLVAEFLADHVLIVARWQVLTERQAQVSAVAIVRVTTFATVAVVAVGPGHLGVVGLAVADLSSDLAAAAVCAVYVRGHLRLGFSRQDLRATLALGLPATPDTILFWLIVSMPLYFLRRGGQTQAAGAFGVAWRFGTLVDLLGNALALGSSVHILRAGTGQPGQQIFRNGIGLIAGASLVLGAFAPEALRWFFPAGVDSARPATPVICLASFFLAAYYFEWIGLSGTRRTVRLTLASAAGAVTGAVGFLVLFSGRQPGVTAAAAVFALSFYAMWIAARWLRTGARFGNAPAVVVTGLVASGLAVALQQLPPSPLGFLGKLLLVSAIGLAVVFWERARRRHV